MGQATADLPNPTEPSVAEAAAPAAPADAASADELLSQLAGEEIDRLLAEADASDKAAATASDAENPPAIAPATGTLAPESPAAGAPLVTPAVVENPVAPASELEAKSVASEIELLLNHADAPAPAPARSLSPSSAPDLKVEEDPQTAAAERAALNPPAPSDPEPPNPMKELIDLSADAGADDAVPLYLKPLEWLNAPLAACPESVRELLGKAAIITLANAVAVLVYVLVFRK